MAVASTSDFADLFSQLEPEGQAWQSLPGEVRHLLYQAWGDGLSRASQRQSDLIDEAIPSTTSQVGLLTDWERVLGIIPNQNRNCQSVVNDDSTEIRRGNVIGKLFAVGDQSANYYISLASQFGYQLELIKGGTRYYSQERGSVTIDDRETLLGTRYNNRYGSIDQRWFWYFRLLDGQCYDPSFETLIEQLAPAHVKVRFEYTEGIKSDQFFIDIALQYFNTEIRVYRLQEAPMGREFGSEFTDYPLENAWRIYITTNNPGVRNVELETVLSEHAPFGTSVGFIYESNN